MLLEAVRETRDRMGEHDHPEITLSILPMGAVLEAYDRDDLAAVRAHLARTAARLASAGCDFFVCPDNTAHLALEIEGPPLALPGLPSPTSSLARRRRAPRCVRLARDPLDDGRCRSSARGHARGWI